MNIQKIQSHLDRIIQYLTPFQAFYNCHMVNFLSDNHWNTFTPENIRKSIKTENDIDEAINDIWWDRNQNTKFAELLKFVEESEKYYLENLNVITPLENVLNIDEKTKVSEIVPIKEFMNEKKRHEVEIMARTTKYLIETQMNHNDFIMVDAGDGKGYLSSRLALEYGLKVLGIDANEINTENAQKRSQKLQRAWNGLKKRAELESQGIKPPRRGKLKENLFNNEIKSSDTNSNGNYKTTNEFITTNLDFNDLIERHFPNTMHPFSVCLTGLHTCGNLASTCLKVFTVQNSIKILFNVGCCYHLLKEEFDNDDYFVNSKLISKNIDYGFPLSQYLKDRKFKLGRNARMLASQSIYRTCSTRKLSSASLFYRALLEVIIMKLNPELKDQIQVGKIQKFSSFFNYVEKCDKKLNLGLKNSLTSDWLLSLVEKYEKEKQYLNVFYMIRMSFSSILETVILLDRLLYLKEMSYENSHIVKLFDSIISPRCYGIICVKN